MAEKYKTKSYVAFHKALEMMLSEMKEKCSINAESEFELVDDSENSNVRVKISIDIDEDIKWKY